MAEYAHIMYGIELSSGRASVVRARRRTSGIEYEVLLNQIDPATAPEWTRIAAEIKEAQKQGRAHACVAAMAADSVVRPVEVPFASPAKARAVLPSLLDVQLPFPLEQCIYAFGALVPAADGKQESIAAAMLNERMQKIIQDAAVLGVDPELVVPEALALWKFHAGKNPATGPGARLVIHFAEDRTVAVAGRGARPEASFSSRTAWAGSDAASRDKLVSRLRQFTAGFLRGEDVANADFIVSGSGADSAGPLLAELGADPARRKKADAPALLACALASYVFEPGILPENLRTGPFESPAMSGHRRRINRASLALVASAALLLVCASAAFRWMAAYNLRKVDTAIDQMARNLTGGGMIVPYQEVNTVKNHPEVGAWLKPVPYPMLAALLDAAAKRGIAIESVKVTTNEVLARGFSSDWNHAAALTNAIGQHTAWNTRVDRTDAGTDEQVHFVVRASP